MLKGGCFCGAVRYETEGAPRFETVCHCSLCRKTVGAPMVAWFTVDAESFRITSGAPAEFASSEHGVRSFCAACGTQIAFRSVRAPDEVDVTTASLDAPEEVPPKDHTRTSSRLSWVVLADGLRDYPESREDT